MRATYLLISLAMLVVAGPAFAGTRISIDNTPANLNFVQNNSLAQNGSLDVYIIKDAGASCYVASYNGRVDLGAPGISLTGIGVASAHPALFPTNPRLGFGSTATLLRVADDLAEGQATAADGSGLFSIKFLIPAGVSGDFPLVLNPAETHLYDGIPNSVPIDSYIGATIHVAPVPEPASFVVLSAAAGCFLLHRRARRPNL
jgi:hypothetical protein